MATPARPTTTTPSDALALAGVRVDVREREARTVDGFLVILLWLLFLGALALGTWLSLSRYEEGTDARSTLIGTSFTVAGIVSGIVLSSLTVIAPGQTRVVQFFGRYVGTARATGLVWLVPLTSRRNVSVRVRNFETTRVKVNDATGNPVEIAAIVVWQVADTAKATFAVEAFEHFIAMQAESAVRHVASAHPYDGPDGTESLRGATDAVSQQLAQEVVERVRAAGLEVIEVRISHLAYAPEIAHAMLQRQQAAAVVAARSKIVEGAVGMVHMALEELSRQDVVNLDEERKAAMVSNLLVVLCGDSRVSPVVNTGGLYQ